MTAQLKLSRNWDYCPVPWKNFANNIHSQLPYIPESVFWVVASVKLRDEYNAKLIENLNKITFGAVMYIEFKQERDLTMFLLRWS